MTVFDCALQKFLLCGSLVLLSLLISGCHPHAQKPPQVGDHTQAQPLLVEQQLLSTISHAEGLGKGNPLLLSSLYSLANFYQERKEYDKGAAQYQRALHLKEEISGPNHPDIVAILQRYAGLLQEAQRPTEAANLLARADAILANSSPSPLAP